MHIRSARRLARTGAIVLAAASAVSAVALTGGGADGAAEPPAGTVRPVGPNEKAHVSFYRARDVRALVGVADTVVIARVESIADGPAWVSDDPRARGLVTDLPTHDVGLAVESRLRGEIEAAPVWSLPLAPGGFEVEHAETPRVGERYLLFLKRHPTMTGRWIVPAIDGRVRIGDDGRARPALSDGVGRALARQFEAGGPSAVRKEIR